jgi:BlaI family penicillinase repressor
MNSSSTTDNISGRQPDPHDPAGLGELEQTILRLVWREREATAERVRDQLHSAGRVLKESTVRTVLRRLEEKGYLTHTVTQRTFTYRPAEEGNAVAGRAAQRIIERFCNGSVEALLVGMLDADVLSEAELQRLAGKIAAARAKESAGKPIRKPASRK